MSSETTDQPYRRVPESGARVNDSTSSDPGSRRASHVPVGAMSYPAPMPRKLRISAKKIQSAPS